MSTQAHTPGPWQIEDPFGPNPDGTLIAPAGRSPVAAITGYYGRDGKTANARLIAAAPDMLAALQGAMVVLDTIPWPQDMTAKLEEALVKRREAIIAAIAKAEGRS